MPTNQKTHYDFKLKILLLGDHSSKKPSFLADLSQLDEGTPAAGAKCVNFRPKSHVEIDVTRNGKRLLVKIVGTAGQERFRSITASFYRGAQGCLILFDAENSDTFMNITKWHEDLDAFSYGQPVTAFLVGQDMDSKNAQVTVDQAEKLAATLDMQFRQVKTNYSDRHLVEVVEEIVDMSLMHASRPPSLTIDIQQPSAITRTSSSDQQKKKYSCSC